MLLPKSIVVGPREYEVNYIEDLRDGSQKLNGHILYDKAEIRIDRDLADQAKRITIMHEVVHGMADAVGVDLKEKEVELLANSLVATLSGSPQLLAMFTEGS